MNHKVSATEAKNRFGAICALAKQGPVLVAKDGRPDTVILSASLYEQLIKSSSRKEDRFPFLLDVQSDILSALPTRLVVPITKRERLP